MQGWNERRGSIMKKIGFFICLISMVMLVGCGPYCPGIIFSDIDVPLCSPDDASGLQLGSKTGTSEMVNYIGWIATGDASIQAAAKNGGITNVKTVDYHYDTILGIVNTTTTTVTGE
jgi:hypothetical protein